MRADSQGTNFQEGLKQRVQNVVHAEVLGKRRGRPCERRRLRPGRLRPVVGFELSPLRRIFSRKCPGQFTSRRQYRQHPTGNPRTHPPSCGRRLSNTELFVKLAR